MEAVRKRIDFDTTAVHPVKVNTTEVPSDPGVDSYSDRRTAVATEGEQNPHAADTASGVAVRPSTMLPATKRPEAVTERSCSEGDGPARGKAVCPFGQWEPRGTIFASNSKFNCPKI